MGTNDNNENSNLNSDVEIPARYSQDDYRLVHEIKMDGEIIEPARAYQSIEPQFEIIKVNNIPLKMEIDSGSPISAVSFDCYKQNFSMLPIQSNVTILRAYNNQQIPAKGKIIVEIQRNNGKHKQTLYIINEGGHPILGREWMYALGMWPLKFAENIPSENQNIKYIYDVHRSHVEELQTEFPEVFSEGFGLFKHGCLSLKVKANTVPKFLHPRKVPFAKQPKLELTIYRLVDNKVLVPIEYSEWGTPIVPVIKSNGEIRICGDFKVTLNPSLEIGHFPSPRPEAVFYELRGGDQFSKLDLAEAYQQLPLDEESQKYVVISTHLGLFKFTRLPYGVSIGPGSFQRKITALLMGIPSVVVYIDDIIITAPNKIEHMKRLRQVLRRLNDAGLK